VTASRQIEPTAEPVPSRPRGEDRRLRRRRRRLVVFVALGVAVLLLGAGIGWYEFQANPLGGPGKAVVVTITPDEAAGTAIDALAADGVIASSFAFRLSDIVHGTPNVEPGSYLFRRNSSFGTVRSILAGGPDVAELVVPAGFSMSEVAQRVTGLLPVRPKGSFLKAAEDHKVTSAYAVAGSGSLEGTIATGHYQVLPNEPATELLNQMVNRFDARAASMHLEAAAATLGVTPAQLVVVASIVEKEGVYPKNMGKVARVIYNRLETGTPLQMDSTVLYSIGQDGGQVTAADLALQTPYNTYLHTGLPPTAICTPSVAALEAAAHPTPGPWRYFQLVSKDGTEQFSVTYAEQLAAEALAQSRGLP
jgi:UPF0755 protein